jgi:hypothetical protein
VTSAGGTPPQSTREDNQMSSRLVVTTITLVAIAGLTGCDRQGARVTPIDTTPATTLTTAPATTTTVAASTTSSTVPPSTTVLPATTSSSTAPAPTTAVVTTALDTTELDAALRDLDAILRDLDTTITTPEGDQS